MLSLAKRVKSRLQIPTEARKHFLTTAPKQHDPLNILFCGSDAFSIHALTALQRLQTLHPAKIPRLEILCRPDKLTGRNYKHLNQVPLKPHALSQNLPLHQLDSFKDWTPPPGINLIVAVSFGLLVPARILQTAKYGGVNVHPSLLPDLRGPAPLAHALLKRRAVTGVSLQTMHSSRFDAGVVLDQASLPVPGACTAEGLGELLAPIGAEMLAKGIEEGRFVPPVVDVRRDLEDGELEHAPKISAEDARVDWAAWTAEEVLLRGRVLGRLWDGETHARCKASGEAKRVVFNGPWRRVDDFRIVSNGAGDAHAGRPVIFAEGDRKGEFGITTCDGVIVCPTAATIDGGKKETGLQGMMENLKRLAKQR